MSDGPGYQWWSSASSDARVFDYRANVEAAMAYIRRGPFGVLGRGRLYTGGQLGRCVMEAADKLVTIRAGDLDELYTRAYGTTEMGDVTGEEHEMLARVKRALEAVEDDAPAVTDDDQQLAMGETLLAAIRVLGYQLAVESRRASEWRDVHGHFERQAQELIRRETIQRQRMVDVTDA